MTPREQCKQLADKCIRDAAEFAQGGDEELALVAVMNSYLLRKVAYAGTDEQCEARIKLLKDKVPELFPN